MPAPAIKQNDINTKYDDIFKCINPDMTLQEMSKAKKVNYLKYAKFVVDDDTYITNEALLRNWHVEMREHGAEVSLNDLRFAEITFYTWLCGKTYERPIIIAAPPAYGKSTMLSVFLRYMVRKYPTFGAVVVKEKIEDLEQLAHEINTDKVSDDGMVFRRNNYAYLIKGYDADIMSRAEYVEQFKTQEKYPVLLLTQKMLELQTLRGNLKKFNTFSRDGNSQNDYPRRLLLIDEKPSLTVSRTLTTVQLNNLVDDIRSISIEASGKVQKYVGDTLDVINELRAIMENTQDMKTYKMSPLKPGYKLHYKLLRDINKIGKTKILENLRAFERAVSGGGIFNISKDGIVKLVTTQKLHYRYTIFNTFILDGTADNDPEYLTDEFFIMQPIDKIDYSHVTFYVCDNYSLSKTALNNSPEAIERIAEMVKRIIAEQKTKVLVTIHQDYKEKLRVYLAKEIRQGKVILKHFDGGRGSNEYQEADTGVFLGVTFKGDLHYSSVTQAVIGDEIGVELKIETRSTKEGLKFIDDLINDYKTVDQAITLIQETNRLRASKKNTPIVIYLFSPDPELIKEVINAYPGCKVKKYEPIEKLTGKPDKASELIAFFQEMPEGIPFKRSEIYKRLDIPKSTFSDTMKNDRVIKVMKQLGIEYATKTKLIKRSV
jgi:hypothetical protein